MPVQIYLKGLSERTGCRVLGKAEFQNPGGSVKDRAALGLITDAERNGRYEILGFFLKKFGVSNSSTVLSQEERS